MTRIMQYSSPLGGITLACEEDALTGLWFDGQKHFGSTLPRDAAEGSSEVLDAAAQWLDRYFAGTEPGPTPPLRLKGSEFQLRVWAALQAIPWGTLRSYGELAAALGSSARAVGGAVARNPISLMVPCHRVVGRSGLTGYAGGLDRKAALLALEASQSFQA